MTKTRHGALLRAACIRGTALLTVTCAAACSAARSDAHDATTASAAPTRWVGPAEVPIVVEVNGASPDLAALDAVFSFWGRSARIAAAAVDAEFLTEPAEPLLAGDVARLARAAGLTAVAFHGTLEDVVYELQAGRPVIVGVTGPKERTERRHFEVVVACDPSARRLRSFDPARGVVERSYSGFQDEWQAAQQLTLVMFASDEATGTLSSIAPATPGERQPPAPSGSAVARPSRDASRFHRPGESPSPHVAQR
jgi:hypothetical protein